jgi:multiple sugar transport system substrate-binding protein
MQWMADLMNKQHVAPSQDEIKQGGNTQMLFTSGKLALWFGEASAAARFPSAIKDFDYDVALPLKGKQAGTWLGGACHTIARDGKQKDAAAQYLLYMAGAEGNKLLAKYAFGVPAVKSVANSDLFLKQPGPPANKAAWLKAFDFGSGPPMTPVWSEVEAALNAELAQTWAGTRSAKDIAAAMCQGIEPYLAEQRR